MQGGIHAGVWPVRLRYDWRRLPLVLLFTVGAQAAQAGEWRMNTHLDVAEVYTDNVLLAPSGSKEDDFITQLSPGISLNGQSGRANVDLNYRMQNLIYANDESRNNTYHQLLARGDVELVNDLLFVDAKSSITQQIVDADVSVPLDNFSVGNRADVVTYGLSPYMKLRFGSYAVGQLRYGIERVENQSATASDAETVNYSGQLGNGPRFNRFTWGVNFRSEDVNRETAQDSLRENVSGVARYRIHQSFNVLARAGYENNDVSTARSIENGGYWSAGGEWLPNRYLTASATVGDKNWDVDLTLRPTVRTRFHVGYMDRSVGLNPGGVWTADFSHYTRRSNWSLSYFEESTSTQTLQLTDQQFFLLRDNNGDVVVDPRTGFPQVFVDNIFTLTDEEFIRQRFQGSVTWRTGKSDFMLGAYNERRDYEISANSEDVLGTNASWSWRIMPRTQSVLGAGWQHRNPPNTSQADDLWHTRLGFTRTISDDASAAVEFRHTQRDRANAGTDYDENRVTLQLNMRF